MKTLLFFITLSPLFMVPEALAQVYRWKDKEGRLIYGDVLPTESGGLFEKLALPDLPLPQEVPQETDWSAKEREFQRRRIDREKRQAVANKAEARRKQRCAALQGEKKYFQVMQGARIARWNSKRGTLDYMSDEDRASTMRQIDESLLRQRCD